MAVLTFLAAAIAVAASGAPAPVIDMHFHAQSALAQGPGSVICSPYPEWPIRDPGKPIDQYMRDFAGEPNCRRKFKAPASDAELLEANAAVLRRRNVIALAGGTEDYVARMQRRLPSHVLPAIGFGEGDEWPTPERLRELHRQGKLTALAEITTQYVGVTPTDPRLAPYWAMAEELDIPVGYHMGPGPPGVSYFDTPKYRMALSDPLQLEEILMRHPKLRVFVMHAGWPMADRMMALMYAHPQVYVETGVIDHAFPRAEFHSYLKRLVDAGFGKRIMFGSDQMVWPEVIEVAIDNIEGASFLTQAQKRDILYNNAARFLRLNEADIARHHRR